MRSQRFDFPGRAGIGSPAARAPDGEPPPGAVRPLFHLRQGRQARRRDRAAPRRLGIATLRFDFTGLGGAGRVRRHTFTANVDDLVAAAADLRRRATAPGLLVGHSLGGAAMLAAAGGCPEAGRRDHRRALRPAHVLQLFARRLPALEAAGEAEVRSPGGASASAARW